MKKIFLLLIVLIFPLCFYGCGNNNNDKLAQLESQIVVLETQLADLQQDYGELLAENNNNASALETAQQLLSETQQKLEKLQQDYFELSGKYYDWQKFIGDNNFNFTTQNDFFNKVCDFINTGRVKALENKYIKIPLSVADVANASVYNYGAETFSTFMFEKIFDSSSTSVASNKLVTVYVTINDMDATKLRDTYGDNDVFYLVGSIESVAYKFSTSQNLTDNTINIRIINGTITEV